jgi:hypothetical protein
MRSVVLIAAFAALASSANVPVKPARPLMHPEKRSSENSQGPILQNFVSAENFSDQFSSSNFRQISTQKASDINFICVRIMDNTLGF